jgi:hypothetical protein
MAALASVASLVGAGAGVYAQTRQAQSQAALQQAQAQQQQQLEANRQQQLVAQQQADTASRQLQLSRTIASARARAGASGISPDEGSAAAITTGLVADSAAAQNASDQVYQARLASGRASLLNPDATLTSFVRAGQSFGSTVSNLLG